MRARALVVVVLLLSYGAVGARQPAVRMAVPLPIPASDLATRSSILSVDRSRFVLDIVRTLFTTGLAEGDTRQREHLRDALLAHAGRRLARPSRCLSMRRSGAKRSCPRPVPDNQIVAAILSDRRPRFSITGSPASTTRRWRGSGPSAIRCAICCGTPARSRSSDRACACRPDGSWSPAGQDAEPMWQAVVGADPPSPSAFVRRLFSDESGVLAWFYDTMSHLDEPRLRFATAHRCRRRPASSA